MSYDAETIAALQSGRLVLRDFLYVRGQTLAGATANFGWWTGEDNVTINVVSAIDGTTESRNYIGGNTFVDVPAIVDQIGLNAQSLDFGLSQIQSDVQDMLRGNNIRVAVVEMHRGYIDPDTWTLVSDQYGYFLGRTDTAELKQGAAGQEGGLTLTAINDTIDLTHTNPAMKSDEQQKLRSSDRFRRYADSAADYSVWWGTEKGST